MGLESLAFQRRIMGKQHVGSRISVKDFRRNIIRTLLGYFRSPHRLHVTAEVASPPGDRVGYRLIDGPFFADDIDFLPALHSATVDDAVLYTGLKLFAHFSLPPYRRSMLSEKKQASRFLWSGQIARGHGR
jgi:hypothetical protein